MSVTTQQWQLISQSITGQRQQERIQQQAIFRVLECLEKQDGAMLDRLVQHGAPVDIPLVLVGPDATPLPDRVKPVGYPFSHISPMGWAAFRDDEHALHMLMNRGADPNFPGPGGRDALWMAIFGQSVRAWDVLRTKDPIWALRTNDGKRTTRLMDAVIQRCAFAVQDIVTHVDLNATDSSGRTALHHNMLQKPYTDVDVQIARMLIEYGAPTTTEDHEGIAPIHMAQTPDQQALMERALLDTVTAEAQARAQAQRDQIEATTPTPPNADPTDPGVPQIQRPVKFKKLM